MISYNTTDMGIAVFLFLDTWFLPFTLFLNHFRSNKKFGHGVVIQVHHFRMEIVQRGVFLSRIMDVNFNLRDRLTCNYKNC